MHNLCLLGQILSQEHQNAGKQLTDPKRKGLSLLYNDSKKKATISLQSCCLSNN